MHSARRVRPWLVSVVVGQPFMDAEWRCGSAPLDIATSIIAGRPEGMPSYRGKLAPTHLYYLVAYVRALGGLVRSDALSARDDRLKSVPPPTLQHDAVPRPGRVRP